jgi:hypothetical protein
VHRDLRSGQRQRRLLSALHSPDQHSAIIGLPRGDSVLQGFAYDFAVFVFEKVCVVVFVVTGDTLPPDTFRLQVV